MATLEQLFKKDLVANFGPEICRDGARLGLWWRHLHHNQRRS